eukprot:325970-Pleurochrysis_carterae.AAC.1
MMSSARRHHASHSFAVMSAPSAGPSGEAAAEAEVRLAAAKGGRQLQQRRRARYSAPRHASARPPAHTRTRARIHARAPTRAFSLSRSLFHRRWWSSALSLSRVPSLACSHTLSN